MSVMQELPEDVNDLVILAEKDGYLMVFTRLPNGETLELLERTIMILESEGLEEHLTKH
jgi:hypothetical protein